MTSFRNSDPQPPIMVGAPPPPEWRVPRNAWDLPPWNRWSFQNIASILPTERIRRSAQPAAWPVAPQDLTEIQFVGAEGQPTTVQDLLDGHIDGFLVASGGRIIHESYHNGMDATTPHLLMSVSKSIVATTAGCLIGAGALDPEAPITAYLPELAQTAWAGATLQHVLDMTSGTAYFEDYEAPFSDIARTDVASGWKERPAGADPQHWPGTLWEQILTLTRAEAEHGARFAYRSIETDVLGLAIARQTGMSLAQAISHHLWAPMGAGEDASVTVDAAGTALGDGGISACLRDLARFGQTMLDDGRVAGRQVIPKAWIDDVRFGTHGLFDDHGRSFLPDGRYRNMFWIREQGRPAHLCLGVFGQFVFVDPETGLVAVVLSTWPEFLSDARHADTMRAIDAIAAEICP